jgi:hypothetical protein
LRIESRNETAPGAGHKLESLGIVTFRITRKTTEWQAKLGSASRTDRQPESSGTQIEA